MRGKSATQATMLTAVTPDALVPQGHPIRRIKPLSSPVPVVRSTFINQGHEESAPHSNVQDSCYVSVVGTSSRVLKN